LKPANRPTFEEAIAWPDARNPALNGRKGRFDVATDERFRQGSCHRTCSLGTWLGIRAGGEGERDAVYRVRPFRSGLSAPSHGYRRYCWRACGKQFNERSGSLLNRTQYPSDVAVVVLWGLRYKLALRDLPEMSS
jgi:hypothetical protein